MNARRYLLLLGLTFSGVLAACSSGSETDHVPTSSGTGGAGAVGGGGADGGGGDGGTTSAGGSSATGGNSGGGQGGSSGGGGSGGQGQGGQGGSGGSGPITCQWSPTSNPCPASHYCDAVGCGTGVCVPIPQTQSDQHAPVCGCDGVNYWNATVAGTHAMSVASNGECSAAAFCGGFGSLQCPSTAHYCSHIRQSSQECSVADMGGVCWGMPQQCPVILIGPQHSLCYSTPCISLCDAIKSQQPFYFDSSCPV